MKVLSPTIHGILDYVVVIAFALAPALLGLSGLPAAISYSLAVVHLLLTLATAFPLGAVKLVPLPLQCARIENLSSGPRGSSSRCPGSCDSPTIPSRAISTLARARSSSSCGSLRTTEPLMGSSRLTVDEETQTNSDEHSRR